MSRELILHDEDPAFPEMILRITPKSAKNLLSLVYSHTEGDDPVLIGLSKKRILWSKAWSRSEKNVLKNYVLLSLRYAVGGGGEGEGVGDRE